MWNRCVDKHNELLLKGKLVTFGFIYAGFQGLERHERAFIYMSAGIKATGSRWEHMIVF